MSGSTRSKSRSPTAFTLQKGSACLNCRKRKIRCDGKHPVCGPCSTSEAFSDCEYTNAGVTRTQALEAQIDVLQQRIVQLERPTPTSSSSITTTPGRNPESITLTSFPYRGIQISELLLENALHTFIAQSPDLGFFLNIARFRDSALSSTPGVQPPTPALMALAHLWGIHLSSREAVREHEKAILARAIGLTAQGLTESHPQAVLQCIQANVLLANYFFRNHRILEGRYHTNAAMSLVICTRLHMIRSSDASLTNSVLGQPGQLPNASDPIEEGERINAFWMVFALSNCWSAADGTPPSLSSSTPGGRIDVPWPREMYEYAQAPFPVEYATTRTVETFLSGGTDTGDSTLALYAKASILLAQASHIGHRFKPDMTPQEATQFYASFKSLEQVIIHFISELPALDVFTQKTSPSAVLLINSLAHAAMIRLHAPFISKNPASRGRIVTCTRIIVHALQTLDAVKLPFIDAIMGIIWVMVAQVLIREIAAKAGGADNEPAQLLSKIMDTMDQVVCPSITTQLVLVRREYADTTNMPLP